MPKFIIPCEWTMYAEVEVESDTLEQAKNKVLGSDLPYGEEVHGSFHIRTGLIKELNPTIKE